MELIQLSSSVEDFSLYTAKKFDADDKNCDCTMKVHNAQQIRSQPNVLPNIFESSSGKRLNDLQCGDLKDLYTLV